MAATTGRCSTVSWWKGAWSVNLGREDRVRLWLRSDQTHSVGILRLSGNGFPGFRSKLSSKTIVGNKDHEHRKPRFRDHSPVDRLVHG